VNAPNRHSTASTATAQEVGFDFLPDAGEAASLIRAHDWASTPLGHPSTWSASLRNVVRFMIANRFPMLLWWGPDYVQLYNDNYVPILGTKHPAQAMGKPFRECWHEVYEILRAMVDTPFNGGPSSWLDDMELIVRRHGFPEESHFTGSYSRVPDDTALRGIGGVLATVIESTEKVIAERRVKILSELGIRVAEANDQEACAQAIETLARHPKDVPFALIYLLDETSRRLRLVGTAGIEETIAGPKTLDLDSLSEAPWPLASALATETTQFQSELGKLLPSVPPGPWADPPDTVAVVPLRSSVARRPAGALVVGISACIRLDERYRSFLDLVGAQVASAVANARAYDEERRRAEALAEIDRAKTIFFSNVSHEFRTPLTLMLGPLEDALAAQQTPPQVRAHLEIAQRNAQRLLKLVNSLLDFARIEAGRLQASYAATDISALTRDLASTFRSAMERAGLELEVTCDPLDEAVYVDRDMWEKIILNLLSNAFKFTLQGRVSVHVARAGNRAVLEVADTGVGVPEDELPRLFERFHRVEHTKARTHEGSGIGLAMVQELVRLHGGDIRVESILDVGTRFRVGIPFGNAHLPADRVDATSTLASTATSAQSYVQEALRWLPDVDSTTSIAPDTDAADSDRRFRSTFGARVVLADDNADMRAYIRELLGRFYAVEATADGAEALDAVRRSRPDLILADVMMPRLTGFELLKTLRESPEYADIPIILVSARAGGEARIEGLGAGADDYVVKPFHARELLARVGALLELTATRRARHQQLEQADRQKNEFLAMLAHELRNPLAPIQNAGELLSRTASTDPRSVRALATIQRQVTHLTRLVDDLLDISRITQGRIELRRRAIRLEQVIAQAVEQVDALILRYEHRVTVVSTGTLVVHGDAERLVQCVANLLINAAKYSPPKGAIRVETHGEGGQAVIRVSDNGIGIAPELLPNVFELFVQGARTLDRAEGGLGVGLTIVKRLVEMHGGSIAVISSGPDQGSTFEIRLPLATEAQPIATSPSREHVRPRHILVVDDNEDAALMLCDLLRVDGHQVLASLSGQEALEIVASVKPEFVLLDIGLPIIDGYEVARRIREANGKSGPRLIALTGYGREEDQERTRAAGFSAHLVKPVNFDNLKQLLASLD
jgi:signal transduction histidine kinase